MAEAVRNVLDPKLLNKVSKMEMRARMIVEGFIAGQHKSPYQGFAIEFASHREYVAGDDLRHLDWNVYYRHDRHVIKQYDLPWHVELHFDARDLLEYETVIDAIPIPVVIDHMGRAPVADGVAQAPFQSLLRKLRETDDLWVKISGAERISATGPPFSDAAPFSAACVEAAPDRCIWGTDWPHPNVKIMPNDGDLVDLIPVMVPDPELRQKVLVDNAARLYGF